jgi:flagellar hook-basal body complex protein FliE
MDNLPIGPANGPTSVVGSMEGAAPATGGETFARLLTDLLSKAANQQAKGDQAILDLAAGNTDNIHRVFLEIIKSELSMRMVLEVRNRLTEAYQQVMQMQV